MADRTGDRKGLTIRDLVTTGIFTALILVFTLIGGVFFGSNPVLTFYMPAAAALLCGPIYLLMMARVQKPWSITIMGILMGVVWFVTGMHWAFALGYMVMGVVADLVAGTRHYRSRMINALSYILFSLGGTGSYLVFFIDPSGWSRTMLGNGTEKAYIDSMQATANVWIMIATFASVLVTASVSALVGSLLLRKQFEKAGITA